MKRLIRYIVICLVAALLPFGVFIAVGESVKNNYENVFTASLVDKYERLNSINEQKIVFVGGSSLPFGLRSDLIESELDMKVVDLGVYAALGTKVMMKISLTNLNSGDIVILAPELSAQTYSIYFGADALWEALNTEREMIGLIDNKEKVDMAYNYFDFLFNKIRISGEEGISPNELYSRTSFNAYGDLSYPRKGNIMAGGYDKSQPITLDILDEDFLQYVRRYVDYLTKKCVDVYFTFSPTNALSASFTAEEAAAFESRIRNKYSDRYRRSRVRGRRRNYRRRGREREVFLRKRDRRHALSHRSERRVSQYDRTRFAQDLRR